MTQSQNLLSLDQLATNVEFSETGLVWTFGDAQSARQHLRVYEPYFAHWGYRCSASDIRVVSADGGDWLLSPRQSSELNKMETSPVQAFQSQSASDDPDYLIVAEQRLSAPLVAALVDIQENPGIKGIVKWTTQKQVILTADCAQIGIGQSVEECLNYSRSQYWHPPHLEEFLRQCQQELRQDGSNSIEFSYLSFDPTTGGDWMQATARYRMIDAGRLGLYQMAVNLDFSAVAAPV